MSYDGFQALRVAVAHGVATVTIEHGAINLFDLALIGEMDRVGRLLEADAGVRAVVLESANPHFFIAHADVTLIQMSTTETFAEAVAEAGLAPIPFGRDLILDPVETTGNLVSGIAGMFDKAVDEVEHSGASRDDFVESVVGIKKAMRELAFTLKVDPYTDFTPRRRRLLPQPGQRASRQPRLSRARARADRVRPASGARYVLPDDRCSQAALQRRRRRVLQEHHRTRAGCGHSAFRLFHRRRPSSPRPLCILQAAFGAGRGGASAEATFQTRLTFRD